MHPLSPLSMEKGMEENMVNQQWSTAMRRAIGTGVAIAILGVGALASVPEVANAAPSVQGSTQVPAKTDVQVIAFQQTWNTIAQECEDTYGPEGVAYVEISPPQETIQGTAWWTSYQPVSYKLDSKLGTEAEFTSMIQRCKAANVGIIADVVLNQATGSDVGAGEQTGVAGTQYNGTTADYPGFVGESNQYPEGLNINDFHQLKDAGGNYIDISDYTNATQVQEGRLSSMWDFDTASDKIQDIQSDYLVKLYNLGVEGFRMDAVKHIAAQDIQGIKDKMAAKVGKNANDIYWIQEVIGNASEAPEIQPKNYFGTGTVTQFDYKSDINAKFKGDIAGLQDLSSRIGDTTQNANAIPSELANVFVTNWDTARNDGAVTYKDGSMYELANAFMLAYDYGTPRLISDYKWDNKDDGAPGANDTAVPDVDFNTECTTAGGSDHYACQQRWGTTRGMIAFHNSVNGTTVNNWHDNGSNVIGFSRGDKGFIAINNSAQEEAIDWTTTLPDGEYYNLYANNQGLQTVRVANGKVTTTLPAMQAIALATTATQDAHPDFTDPSTPQVVIPSNTVTPDDTTLSIYYKAPENFTGDKAYVHYGNEKGWTNVPGVAMHKDAQGYFRADIETDGIPTEIVFNDGNNNWDNPNGGGNYKPSVGVTQISVVDHEMSVGNPESVGEQTRLLVHYKPAPNDPDRGVYVWGKDSAGNDMKAQHHAFTGEDCYGKVGEFIFDGKYDQLGTIITTENWDKFGADRLVQVRDDGTAEIWVDGTGDADTTLITPPTAYKCKASQVTVTVHYMRADGKYFDADDTVVKVPQWDLWTWNANSNGFAGKFTEHDEWGELSTLKFSNYTYVSDDQGISDFGLLRRYGGDQWAKKDGSDGDVKMTANALVFDKDGNAKAEVWLVQDDATVYTARPSLGAKITVAEIAGSNTIAVKLSKPVAFDDAMSAITVTDADGTPIAVKKVAVDNQNITITTDKALDITALYKLSIEGFGEANVIAGAVVRTDEFDTQYAYDGNDLGATYAKDGSLFKLWAPTAQKVSLVTFKDASETSDEAQSIEMKRSDKGVWNITAPVDDGTAYVYRVQFADGTVNDSPDPYAKAAVINGKRSVILSHEKTSVHDSKRMTPFTKPTDAIIAETHIRDFTKNANSGVSSDKRGTYLGMIEEGTKNSAGKSTGVDYLKELGITHVQIQPMYDFNSVNEAGTLDDANYNWGYDPQNYNVPEGSYASDPADPSNRIVEAKQMVDGLHKNGIRVIMDVVYNHVADANTNPFNLTVPGYYFRYNNGSLVNNSGCGNDTASERAMMRKYIVDSVTYWAREYHMDGFRFDLMGLHDIQTMKAVRAALDEIDPTIIIVGEGWDMNTTMDKSAMSIQPNASKLDTASSTVSFFNDSIRDGLKGSVFSDEDNGFASGKQGIEGLIANNMLGCMNAAHTADGALCTNGNAPSQYANAGQVVNYVEIHDNLTLNDKLEKSLFANGANAGLDEAAQKAKIIQTAKLADSAVFSAFGIAEFQVGQEFLRTKGGNANSYNVGDTTNMIDWDRMNDAGYGDNAQYVKDLIAIRKRTSALRMDDYEKIANTTKLLQTDGQVVAYEIARENGTYVVVLNAADTAAHVPDVTGGDYAVLVSNGKTYLHPDAASSQQPQASPARARQAMFLAEATPQGTDVSVAGSTVSVDHNGIEVPSNSMVLLAPTSDLDPDAPANPAEPGDTNKDPATLAPDAHKPSDAASANKADIAMTGVSIAHIIGFAIAVVCAAILLLARKRAVDQQH